MASSIDTPRVICSFSNLRNLDKLMDDMNSLNEGYWRCLRKFQDATKLMLKRKELQVRSSFLFTNLLLDYVLPFR